MQRTLDGDHFGCLVRKSLNLRLKPLLGFLHSFLSADNRTGDHGLLASLFHSRFLVVIKVDSDAQGFPQLVDSGTSLADEMGNMSLFDRKFNGVAIDNIVVLGVLDDLQDGRDDTIDLGARTSDDDHVLVGLAVLFADADRGERVLAENGSQDAAAGAYDVLVPFL